MDRGKSQIPVLEYNIKQIGTCHNFKSKETNPAFQGSEHHMCSIETVDKVGREGGSLFHAIHYEPFEHLIAIIENHKPSALAFGSEMYTD